MSDHEEARTGAEIAIVGLAGRFPGAASVDELWRNLRQGIESISFLSEEELLADGADPETLRRPEYVRARGVLEGAERFDAAFFDIPPREAEVMDPQHRLFLECAWEALESAGYDPRRLPGSAGVFAGVTRNSYLEHNLLAAPGLLAKAGEGMVLLGNDKDFVAARVSYKLDLTGPAVAVQSACSTSLVAVHLACQSLLAGECDVAIAGGASVRVPQKAGYLHAEGGVTSPDGHCRPFDAAAGGTVIGSGVGAVVLKPLDAALADGDTVWAVIKGSAVTSDGAQRVGFSAPGVDGQARAIEAALAVAEVEADSLGYVEAHGTATPLGDRIELAALKRAFRASTDREGFCALGSIKSNIGHLDAAAGVAGLIKVALACHHREIPPTLHFERPNPELEGSPFYVNTRLAEWPAGDGPRRAGLNSFGMGGSNAHVVVEEAPEPEPGSPSRPWQLLVLSARTPEAREAASSRLADWLESHPEIDLADAAHTLRLGRAVFDHRRTVVCQDREEAVAALRLAAPERVFDAAADRRRPPVAFLFPGQGAQYAGMARDLYEAEPAFRAEVERACDRLRPHLGRDLREVLDPPDGAESPIDRTAFTQPALFVVEYALARLWMSWGVAPESMLGHSIGEYVAACLAGVLSLDDALALVAARGRLMQSLPAGAMTAVRLSPEALEPLLGASLSLAAVNGPERCVASGTPEAVAELEERLRARDVGFRRLATSHAFHSALVEPILDAFTAEVRKVRLSAPSIPYLSNVTGTWIRPEEATDPGYWVRHLRSTVRFSDTLTELWREPRRVVLEVGPGGGFAAQALEHPGDGTAEVPRIAIASLPQAHERRPGEAPWLEALGRLWMAGVEPDWSAFQGEERRRRVPLPTYPFERRRYWVEPESRGARADAPSRGRRPDPADWFYVPSWKRSVAPRPAERLDEGERPPAGPWLLLGEGGGVAAALRRRLEEAGLAVAAAGSAEAAEPGRLLARLAEPPRRIVDLRGLDPSPDGVTAPFFELAGLVRALAETPGALPARLAVVTAGAWEVTGGEPLRPENALRAAPARSIPLDLAGCDARAVDLLPGRDGWAEEAARQIAAELAAPPGEPVVAYRHGHRWLPSYEPVRLAAARPPLRPGGVYLITGGTSGLGFEMARWLAREARARLVLASRSGDTAGRAGELEALGAEVLVLQADAADAGRMREVVEEARARFGAVHGVIHAAGVPGGGLMQLRSPEAAAGVLRPKVEGARVLAGLFAGRELDFLALCSSLTALAGGAGQADYAAANAWLDTFAHDARRGGLPVLSIDWDAWKEVGMAARAGLAPDAGLGLLPAEGVEALGRVLAAGLPQAAVCTREIRGALAEMAAGAPERPQSGEAEARHERPSGRPYVAPRDRTERALAGIWEEVFGVAPIGIHDRFGELGGHSLLATQVQSRLRERLGADLPLATVLECATVAELAVAVTHRLAEQAGTSQRPAAAAPPAGERIPPRAAPADRFPVSFSQLRLWLLDRLETGTGAYNIYAALRIAGRLRPAVLVAALCEIVRRHEALRTVFEAGEGEPVQVVLPPRPLPVPLVDLTALGDAGGRRELDEVARAELLRGFDLACWPLLRTTLVRLGESEHALLLVVHHSVSDGWSMGVLFRDIAALYEAFVAGRPSPLPELPIQYPDFAVWQRERLSGESLERLLAYWRGQLAGAEPVLELPTDRRRPPALTFRGGHHQVPLPLPLEQRLQARRGPGETLFMQLLAALEVLLARYSGQDDFSVGTFIANRTRAEIEDLIGFFVNTLVLRANLAALGDGPGSDPDTADLLRQVRRTTVDAYAHQDLPLERLLEALQPKRDPSRTPLFQVMLVLQNTPQPVSRFAGLTMSFLPVEARRSNFDLTFWLQPAETGEGLMLDIEYSTDLFDAATVARLAGHYLNLLAAFAEEDRPLRLLPLMSGEERRQVLALAPGAVANFEAETPVHRRIAERARLAPEAPALEAGDERLTYRELDRRAALLAARLRHLGAGPESIVGLALRRSPEAVVALLAVLRSGAAYLPLDPDYPRERLELMLREADVAVVLTHGRAAAPLPAGVRTVWLDREVEEEGNPAELPEAQPENAAYLIFTSGSTGVPKGVVVSHRALANHTASAAADYGIGPGDRVLQFASLNFDTSAEEIYPCLAAGATLVLRDDAMMTSAGQFLAAVERLGISVLDLPTAYWHELAAGLAQDGVRFPPAVRLVILGGERALPDRLAAWFGALGGAGGVRLVNSYGPTEGTIVTTRHDLTPGTLAPSGEPPIGRPIHNARVYVVDPAFQAVPAGVPGELLIGGLGVARGYLRRPELTAERFLPDPFAGEPGARLYRSGDRARWLASGALEFLGRVDTQVKIRGFRVEVGEVEAALRRQPGLRDAVVEARPDASGTHRLVAYVVPEGGAVPAVPEGLRAALRERLPDYLVPSAFVALPSLPKTPSGKIDRRALAGLAAEEARPAGSEADTAYVAPKSELEGKIARIWQEVLGVERVGAHDNFFDLGGHSLLMVQAHRRLSEALGRDLDILLLFQRPTVSALARELAQKEPEKPAFDKAREMVQQQRHVNLGRKQFMERRMQQKKGKP